MHYVDKGLCHLFLEVLDLGGLTSGDFNRSMVSTLIRLVMLTMTCLGAAEDNRPVPE